MSHFLHPQSTVSSTWDLLGGPSIPSSISIMHKGGEIHREARFGVCVSSSHGVLAVSMLLGCNLAWQWDGIAPVHPLKS